MRQFLSVTVVLLAWYLLGAFIAWDINPGNWNAAGRYMIGLMGGISALVVWLYEGL